MFIKLTNGAENIYVNASNIIYFSQNVFNKFSHLEMTNGNSLTVNESPEEILKLIKGTYLNV